MTSYTVIRVPAISGPRPRLVIVASVVAGPMVFSLFVVDGFRYSVKFTLCFNCSKVIAITFQPTPRPRFHFSTADSSGEIVSSTGRLPSPECDVMLVKNEPIREKKNLRRHLRLAGVPTAAHRQKTDHGVSQALTRIRKISLACGRGVR